MINLIFKDGDFLFKGEKPDSLEQTENITILVEDKVPLNAKECLISQACDFLTNYYGKKTPSTLPNCYNYQSTSIQIITECKFQINL